MLPDYCCAIIQNRLGWILLQLRPSTARFAANQLTCFGGMRKSDEDPMTCLRRELNEELSWLPDAAEECCQLWQGDHFIAQFYRALCDRTTISAEPGHCPLWAPWKSLPGLPLSPWHRQVLAAVSRGRGHVDLSLSP
jgi:8-oxo-dGTP pyrophosphatase MutT (NUDIX family)